METTTRSLRPFGYNTKIPHLVVTDEELRAHAMGQVLFGDKVKLEGRVWKWSPIQCLWITIVPVSRNPLPANIDDDLATVTLAPTVTR